MMSEPTDIDDGLLCAWLDGVFGDRAPVEVVPLTGGASCDVFTVRRAGQAFVLRRAPVHAVSGTAHDVLREFRILDAIKDAQVRIARPVAACDDAAVAGAPFYLMQHVDGVPIRQEVPPAYRGSSEGAGALDELCDALVELHAVDWGACGLSGLGRTERYLERQVPRWLHQLEGYRMRDLPEVETVAAWLERERPGSGDICLVHGDYKLDNALFSRTLPPRLLVIVDWEMASLGDPLVDLAWAMIFHPEQGNGLALGAPGTESGFSWEGLPDRAAFVRRYARRSGRDVSNLHWYDVFARWKLAIVLEGSHAKHLRGESTNPVHAFFGQLVDMLLSEADELTKQHDDTEET